MVGGVEGHRKLHSMRKAHNEFAVLADMYGPFIQMHVR